MEKLCKRIDKIDILVSAILSGKCEEELLVDIHDIKSKSFGAACRVRFVQLVKSLPSSHKFPGLILGFAAI